MATYGIYGIWYKKAVLVDGVVIGYEAGPVKMMGEAVEARFSANSPAENPLYANNTIVENDSSAANGGTLTHTLAKLTQNAAADLFGLTVREVSVDVGGETETGTSLEFHGNEQSAPVGVAYIRYHQENNVRKFEADFFRRAEYSLPEASAKTKGESIEWQTPELSAKIYGMEGDGSNPWHSQTVFTSDTAAKAWVERLLGEGAPEDEPEEGEEGTA